MTNYRRVSINNAIDRLLNDLDQITDPTVRTKILGDFAIGTYKMGIEDCRNTLLGLENALVGKNPLAKEQTKMEPKPELCGTGVYMCGGCDCPAFYTVSDKGSGEYKCRISNAFTNATVPCGPVTEKMMRRLAEAETCVRNVAKKLLGVNEDARRLVAKWEKEV